MTDRGTRVTDEWHPRIGRRTLSGASARSLSVTGNWCLGVGMLCAVAAGVLLWGFEQGFVAFLVLVPGMLGVTAGRVLDSVSATRAAREHGAGYATQAPGTGPSDVEVLDPRTGRLVSFAGEALTDAERRARVAAIRADARLGGVLPDPVPVPAPAPLNGGPAVEAEVEDSDEALFAGRPRTFVTLPWTVRQGVVWGLLLVVLAPLGLVAAAFAAVEPVLRSAAPVIFRAVLVGAVVGAVVLVVSMRRTDAVLADTEGPITRRTVLTIWIMVFAMALVTAGGFVYCTVENGYPDGPDLVVAEADLAEAGPGVGLTADLGRAAALSALWGLPWFLAWTVLVRRAARRPS